MVRQTTMPTCSIASTMHSQHGPKAPASTDQKGTLLQWLTSLAARG